MGSNPACLCSKRKVTLATWAQRTTVHHLRSTLRTRTTIPSLKHPHVSATTRLELMSNLAQNKTRSTTRAGSILLSLQ